MTERLYYTDSYLRDFDARVVERADGGRRVYLDRTAFYPTSGGQPFDTGTLGGAPVVDVIDEGDRIAHVLAEPPSDDDRVACHVDWARRFDHMQQHTGQHLLSAVLASTLGCESVSVHFGAETSTLDLDADSLARDDLLPAEERANALVFENRPVTVSFEDAATATGLRRASSRAGTLRIVTIDRLDRSACGGTHVRATGEIGPILVRKVERVRRATRLEFVCGMRAVRRARADFDMLSELARTLSASAEEVPALVRAQGEELRAATGARRELETQLHEYRARELYAAAPPNALGVRRVLERRAAGSLDELRGLAQAVAALPRAVFVGAVSEPAVVILAASEDSGVDAGAELKRALGTVGGRGGGSPRVAQGSVPDLAALERLLTKL